MPVRSMARIGALVGAGALLVAACGGGTGSEAAPPKSTPATNAPVDSAACVYLNEADAASLFGIAAKQTPDPANDPAARSSCIWKAADNDHHIFLLQIRLYSDAAQYSETRPGTEHLTGLGEKAIIRKQAGLGSTEVRFVRDGRMGVVNYVTTNIAAKHRKSAADQDDQLVAMMRQNLSRV